MGSVGGEEAMEEATKNHEERIQVSVRIRPLNDKEIARNDVSDWECINDTTIIYRNNISASERSLYPTAYSFDRVFRSDCSTRQVYQEAAKEVALSVVSGINSSIFAYGQTSSGKTYTMSGITDCTVADIFNYMGKHMEREFILKFSAIEIYNESVRDLLSADYTPLRLLDDPERGTVVEKLTEETIRDWNHFTELISFCETQRQIGETSLNEASSRSHQILRLTVESSAREFLGNDKCSSLSASVNFVDLAGSERASQTNSAGVRLKEGCHINRSLLTLGTVIRKLSKGRNGHIPFRDSKLTRILQSSLGGNARTAIICTMSPARSHVEQTRNTLFFASCAKEVETNAQVNVVVSDKALVKQLQKEVAKLESELRNSGPARPNSSDSTALLREKDQEIEMLKKEVKELTLQRDLAQVQIKDMLQEAGNNMSSLIGVESLGPRYPKLRVTNNWNFETRREEPNVLSIDCEESVRSFDASQYSDGHSISSDDNLFQLPDLEKDLMVRNSSPRLTITSIDAAQNDLDQQNIEDQDEQDYCKEVRCIELEEPITNQHTHTNSKYLRSNTYSDSSASSPRAKTDLPGLIVVDDVNKNDTDFCSSGLKEDKRVNHLREYFALPTPESSTPWLTENNRISSSSSSRPSRLSLSRSRSCKASLMKNLPSDWFEDDEEIQNTPPVGNEKDFAGRPEGFLKKVHTLNYNANAERNSMESSAADESGTNGLLTPKRKETENLKRLNLLADHEVPGIELDAIMSAKNVKDIGLDPMQADGENHSEWPLKFKRLQKEIIELWDACNVSLVHRTYFFLLFKGDPLDSIYLEVEHRRLLYLKQTFSQGNKTLQDGRTLTPETSMRYLRRERQMLCKQMQKKLSKYDREDLYMKWSIHLSSKHRRLQLAHHLWTDTNNIDHIRESAAVVAKLVGPVEPEQALKEMFGLNFAPRSTSRKSFSWSFTNSMRQIL
ncbi:putative plus-end-directed kinesin ATPase [Medicago truncatula]|uniref:Kinesin-like protein n=1 Tax=Medicago truncatula TaxID=3880 RepID=G7KGE9_MEDTR|nr:kinesin-like protein KIN-7F [Medicago truncatula]XP_024640016.1 kinesin-like protein KIN-7F [Medicago truncatula]AES95091.2 ATP-binding microtubule motor family protein [Medicago truncatula]RHN54298.1 putative plus-end-directed kinesin ATPase [Medicago truncatula]